MDNFSADEIALFDQGHALYLDLWRQLVEFTRDHANTAANSKSLIFAQLSRTLLNMVQDAHTSYHMNTHNDITFMNNKAHARCDVSADNHLCTLDCEMLALILAAGIVETAATATPMPNPFNTECA